ASGCSALRLAGSRPWRTAPRPGPADRRRRTRSGRSAVPGEEFEPRRPGGEETKEERLEELLEQHFEPLVVIRSCGLRHDRLPVEPNPQRASHFTSASGVFGRARLRPSPQRNEARTEPSEPAAERGSDGASPWPGEKLVLTLTIVHPGFV